MTDKPKRTRESKPLVVMCSIVTRDGEGGKDGELPQSWFAINGQPTHKDSAAAWKWVVDNGEAGKQYRVMRDYGIKTLAKKVTETSTLE